MAGKKGVLFGKELRKNELKTLVALIDFNRSAGKVQCLKLTLIELRKKTKIRGIKTSGCYQLELLASLIKKNFVSTETIMVPKKHQKITRNKEKQEYKRKIYFLKPEYQELFKDWIITSEAQDDIEKLQSEGMFAFLNTTTFGIKKEWHDYPEIHYLHEIVENALKSLYGMKQLRAICLLRDFAERWHEFLQLDMPDIAEHWLWETAKSQLSPYFERNDDKLYSFNKKIVKELAALKLESTELSETVKKMEEQDELRLKKLKEEIRRKWYPDSIPWKQVWFGEKLPRKMDGYNKEKAETVMFVVRDILDDSQWQQFRELLDWILFTFHEDVNKIGFYADIGSLSFPSGLYYDKDMKVDDKDAIDNDEYIFRAFNNETTSNRLKEVIEDIDKKEKQKIIFEDITIEVKDVEEAMRDIIDIHSMRNADRLNQRFNGVFSNVIQKPRGNTSLKKYWNRIEDSTKDNFRNNSGRMKMLKADIIKIVKKEKPKWLDLKKTDDEIFSMIMAEYGSHVPRDVLESIVKEIETTKG